MEGFFSLFSPLPSKNSSELEDLQLASRIFRAIHGHEVILRVVAAGKEVMASALQTWEASDWGIGVVRLMKWAYRIIGLFAKANAENKELLTEHLVSLLPTYGAMF